MRTAPTSTATEARAFEEGSMNDTVNAIPTADRRATIECALRTVTAKIAPVWPLERFVAVNPYVGLADLSFADAAELLARAAGARATLPAAFYLAAIDAGRITDEDLTDALAAQPQVVATNVAEFVERARVLGDTSEPTAPRIPTVASVATACTGRDWERFCTDRVSAWAAAYFDHGQAMWTSADAELPLFAAWKEEACLDRTPEVMGVAGFRSVVRSLPDDPIAAAERALRVLDVPTEAIGIYLHALALRVGGWAAHAARIGFERQLHGHEDDTLVQFLAVLLAWELAMFHSLERRAHADAWHEASEVLALLEAHPEVGASLALLLVLQDAFDRSEQRRIIDQFAQRQIATDGPHDAPRPSAQAVFCIDVRSEVFRRNLESLADGVDTIGFAGFFGFPIDYLPIAHVESEAQCPVLLTPAFSVTEAIPDPERDREAIEDRRLSHHVQRAWKSFKMGAISCFSFVGPVGLLYLPKLFTDTYGKTRPAKRADDEGLATWAVDTKAPKITIPLETRVQLAEGALRGMSLTDSFAPIVLIVGHGANTVNNPYNAGLDCGACGGHTGEANARVAATILNDPAVRAGLVERGLDVPEDTWFVAALHDTTTDIVTLFDRSFVPPTHTDFLGRLQGKLREATRRSRIERAGRLGISAAASVDAQITRRATDWAQVRPEWGLAGCRAFIAAPRGVTKDLDLEGRAFLHSYEWQQDRGFGILELILTAPVVVASWINLQYYASTVDNRLFGSGNKTLHNVVGKTGVLEGNGGDLRVGLPWQSLHDGKVLQHEPLRLNVVIRAPRDAINHVLATHDNVRNLFDNGWIHLLAMDDEGCISHRYTGTLNWAPVASANEAGDESSR
jgi:uncharacterized protein YbcC (UPF0753/DUF2309 family)